MSIHYRAAGSSIIIFGNTYPLREKIKALGARYNGPDKNWRLPFSEAALARVDELCRAAGGGGLASPAETAPPLPDESISEVANSNSIDKAVPNDTAGISVAEVIERAYTAINQAFPRSIWVVGEVQNFSRKASGIYFDLAEGRESGHHNATLTIRALIWSQTMRELNAKHAPQTVADIIQDGMKVRCLCQVQLYRDRSSLSLVIEDIDPAFTKGALALAREKLLKELRSKGLDQANKRRLLPAFPFRIGLISAEGSRAKSDFIDQLTQGGFPGEVWFCPTPMQGDSVPGLVASALTKLSRTGCDLIVLTRGGGSAADLRWFDAAEIAYAIAACPIPVIAAIGHHDDICVAEEVCHLRQKTPTAAADFVLDIFRQTKEKIDRLALESAAALDRKLVRASEVQASLSERLALAAQSAITRRHERLQSRCADLERSANMQLTKMQQTMASLAGELDHGITISLNKKHQTLVVRNHELTAKATDRLSNAQHQLAQKANTLDLTMQQQIGKRDKLIDHLTARLAAQVAEQLARATTRLTELDGLLGRVNPRPWIDRGWTQFAGPRGPVRRRADLKLGEIVSARLNDVLVKLKVESFEERKG